MTTKSALEKGAVVGAVSALAPWIALGLLARPGAGDVARMSILWLPSALAGTAGGAVLGGLTMSLEFTPRWQRRIALLAVVPVVEFVAFALAMSLALLVISPWTPDLTIGGAFGGGLFCAIYGTVLGFPTCAIGCLVLEAWTRERTPPIPIEVFD